jgi:hypothetical protein
LGHELDFVPGNHDRQLYNEHVWGGEVEVAGKTLGGFTQVIAEELRCLGASEQEVKDSLARLHLRPFAMYGNHWVEHGDMGDAVNRVQRPYKELLDPTPLHEEMSMALGDYGVRGGFNNLEQQDPTLDAIDNTMRFFRKAFKHPMAALGLIAAFLRGSKQEGYVTSKEADLAQRVSDVRDLVTRFPAITEQLNSLRPAGDQLTNAQVIDGLQALEKKAAVPFFSQFKRGTRFLRRLFSLAMQKLTGKSDTRSREQIYLDRLLATQKQFGAQALVQGHTHHAQDDVFLTDEEKVVRMVNTHTWMDKDGDWGRPEVTWGEDGRGVGVIEVGKDATGQPWSSLALRKVVDESGTLVWGDILDDAAEHQQEQAAAAHAIYDENHPPAAPTALPVQAAAPAVPGDKKGAA